MAVTVRKAEFGDIPWLIEQAHAFEEFAGYRRALLRDPLHARDVFTRLITDHLILIATDGAHQMGVIAGWRSPHPFNPTIRVLAEVFWWVPETYRNTRAGVVLLREFERVGRLDTDWVIFSLEHNSPVREAHLTKRGFRMVERAFLLEV